MELNLNEMGKDARSTMEQFQRWIQSFIDLQLCRIVIDEHLFRHKSKS